MTIGRYPVMSLKEARSKVLYWSKVLSEGKTRNWFSPWKLKLSIRIAHLKTYIDSGMRCILKGR